MTRLNQALCISAATIALTAGTALALTSAPNKLNCEGYTSQVTGKKHQWVTTCNDGKTQVPNVLSDAWDSNPNKFDTLMDSINSTSGKNALKAHQNKLALAFGLKENTVFATQMYTINTASGERVDLAMSAALDKTTTPVPTVDPIAIVPTAAPKPAGGTAWTDPATGDTYTVYAPIPTAKPATVTPTAAPKPATVTPTTAPTGVVLLPKDPVPTAKPVTPTSTGVALLPKDPHPTTAPVPTSTIPTSKPTPASTSTTNPNIDPSTGCPWGQVKISGNMCGTVKTNPVPTPAPTPATSPGTGTTPTPTVCPINEQMGPKGLCECKDGYAEDVNVAPNSFQPRCVPIGYNKLDVSVLIDCSVGSQLWPERKTESGNSVAATIKHAAKCSGMVTAVHYGTAIDGRETGTRDTYTYNASRELIEWKDSGLDFQSAKIYQGGFDGITCRSADAGFKAAYNAILEQFKNDISPYATYLVEVTSYTVRLPRGAGYSIYDYKTGGSTSGERTYPDGYIMPCKVFQTSSGPVAF